MHPDDAPKQGARPAPRAPTVGWPAGSRRRRPGSTAAGRCPKELIRWFPQRVEGSLAVAPGAPWSSPTSGSGGTSRSSRAIRRFEFRWPWGKGKAWETTVSVRLSRPGYGTRLTLTDGPSTSACRASSMPTAEALEGWGEALALAARRRRLLVGSAHPAVLSGGRGARGARASIRRKLRVVDSRFTAALDRFPGTAGSDHGGPAMGSGPAFARSRENARGRVRLPCR